MGNLVMRNLKIFFRQKSSVFFSLLAVFIVLGLYILFLGDVWKDGLEGIEGVDALMGSWIVAGIVTVASCTTTLGALGTIVEDRCDGRIKDFNVSPVRQSTIVASYILCALIVGILMSVVAFILGEAYIVYSGGELLPVEKMMLVLGIIVLASAASASFMFFVVSFFSRRSAFTTASTIIGTLIGFLMGIYLPIGMLPEFAQTVIKIFPLSHAAALLRQVLMQEPIATSFAGVPVEYVEEFETMMGVTFTWGTTTFTVAAHVLVLIGATVLFSLLALLNMRRMRRVSA